MDALLGGLEGWPVAAYLRFSRWGYAAVNAAHIFGIALLVGTIVPMNLRLLGVWPGVPRAVLARVLVPVAAAGLVIAVSAGILLFSVRAQEYMAIGFLQLKLVLVLIGTLSAARLHFRHGVDLDGATRQQLIGHALVSLTCWPAALMCGRLIAFAGD